MGKVCGMANLEHQITGAYLFRSSTYLAEINLNNSNRK